MDDNYLQQEFTPKDFWTGVGLTESA